MGYGNKEHVTIKVDQGLKQEVDSLTSELAQNVNVSKGIIGRPKTTQSFNKTAKPVVVFTIDDGGIEDLTVLKPIFDEYGYKATSYIISQKIGIAGCLDSGQLKALQDDGWEIGSHSVTHGVMGNMGQQNLEYEFIESKNELLKYGLNVANFAYPFGSYTLQSNEIGINSYDSLAMFGTGHNDVNMTPIRPAFLKRVSMGSNFDATNVNYPITNTFEDYYKPMIDKAIANNGLLVFALHSHPQSEDPVQMQYFRDTLAYLQTNSVSVMTLKEALEIFKNTIDIEMIASDEYNLDKYLKVSHGKLYTNIFQATVALESAIDNNTNADQYPTLSTSYKAVNTSQGFPFDGYLIHENNTEWKNHARQILYSLGNTVPRIAFRNSKSDGTWTVWRELAEKRPSKLNVGVNVVVPANGKKDFTVADSNALWNDTVIANPTNVIPAGVSYYCWVYNGNAIITFHNHTTADVTVNRAFNVSLVSGS